MDAMRRFEGTMVNGGLGALARALVMALAIALIVLLFF